MLFLCLRDHKKCLFLSGCLITNPSSSHVTTAQLILSGGEGYINFRIGKLKNNKTVLKSVSSIASFVHYLVYLKAVKVLFVSRR